ncbi:MAG: hypothetical protein EZS28_027860 [Streblomastix strix]|uniref:Uncharacterized protein n=1 Tax=Streblomastix strix TaxID=222440 RepID=A0A5J4V3K8_9EUKA|nr:MAG: hypothetical protein EZS28_027860 [Streblomastix strix]
MFHTVGFFALLGLFKFNLQTIACTISDYTASLLTENKEIYIKNKRQASLFCECDQRMVVEWGMQIKI